MAKRTGTGAARIAGEAPRDGPPPARPGPVQKTKEASGFERPGA